MAKGTLQIKYEKLVMDNLDLKEQIKELEAEVIKHRQGRLDSLELISEYDQKWGTERISLNQRIVKLEALRDTVSVSCHPPKDCNDPEVLKTYMKACFDESQKLY